MTLATRKLPLYLLALLMAGVVLGFGFAGWIRHAGALMLALTEQSLSWCL